jgi:phage-related tail fiber protein
MPQQRSMTEVQPPGMVQAFAQSTAPAGWLLCNGAAVNRTTYSDLFAAIGTVYGAGDGSSSFNLPDLRGEFLRGWDASRGVDTNAGVNPRGFASVQKGTAISYNLPKSENLGGGYEVGSAGNDMPTARRESGVDYVVKSDYVPSSAHHNTAGPRRSNTGGEAWITDAGWGGGAGRPRNFSLLLCVKY